MREQVIDGKNGYFVSSKDEFESRLEEYAAHPEKRREHGRNGRHLVETHWTIENQRDRMNRLLNRLSQYGSSQTT
ncbi:glycosyltransferase involved in cell wall biosynthesis [Salinibacter ruber]|nr:glycosyltransferase involved in cell wall biosynthesis [Salinibacter ruber]